VVDQTSVQAKEAEVDWKRVADRARDVINQRGGPGSLKEDADELRDIADGPGTLADKAKQAAEALREPGAHREARAGGEAATGGEPGTPAQPAAAEEAPENTAPEE
jgi:hypothetical protein